SASPGQGCPEQNILMTREPAMETAQLPPAYRVEGEQLIKVRISVESMGVSVMCAVLVFPPFVGQSKQKVPRQKRNDSAPRGSPSQLTMFGVVPDEADLHHCHAIHCGHCQHPKPTVIQSSSKEGCG